MRVSRVLTAIAVAGVAVAGLSGCSPAGTPKGAVESLLDALSSGDVEQFRSLTALPLDDPLVTMLPNATERIADTSVTDVGPAVDGEESRTVQVEYSVAGQVYADSVQVTKNAESGDWLVEPPTVPVVTTTGTAFTLGGVLLGAGSDGAGSDGAGSDGAGTNGGGPSGDGTSEGGVLGDAGAALPGTYPVEMSATLVSLAVSEVNVAPQEGDAPVWVDATINEAEFATVAQAATQEAIQTCFDGGMTALSMPTRCLGSFAGHIQGPIKFMTMELQGDVPELVLESEAFNEQNTLVLTLTATDTLSVQTTLKNSLYVDGEDTVTTENLSLRVDVILKATGSAIRWISVDGWEAA